MAKENKYARTRIVIEPEARWKKDHAVLPAENKKKLADSLGIRDKEKLKLFNERLDHVFDQLAETLKRMATESAIVAPKEGQYLKTDTKIAAEIR